MSPPLKPVKPCTHRRRLCLAALATCLLFYCFIDHISDYAVYKVKTNSAGYFINTSGCHTLGLNPVPLSVLPYLVTEEAPLCTQYQLLSAVTVTGHNYLRVNMREQHIRSIYFVNMSNISCTYLGMLSQGDFHSIYSYNATFRLNPKIKDIEVKPGVHRLRVFCQIDGHTAPIYHDVHFFMPLSQMDHTANKQNLSVMILGIDSISHMHYLRFMTKTSAFISYLPHVKFWGHNRVGRDTYESLLPLFSGLNSKEILNVCLQINDNFDSCHFIWKDFKAAGYRTSFAEDATEDSIFTQGKEGFLRQPTDFYLRPVLQEMNLYTRYDIGADTKLNCSGERTYSDVLLEFTHKLMPHLQRQRFFSFFWRSSGVKDNFGYAQHVDNEYEKLLKHLEKQGIFNHTLVLLMSAYGIRHAPFSETYQGKVEESLPLLVAIYPKWLATHYPQAVKNLRQNANRLVTTYDLHATLKDLLNLAGLRNAVMANRTTSLRLLGQQAPRQISLFLPIPEIRDCQMAGIPKEYCLCHELSKLSEDDTRAQRAARFVVRIINQQLKYYKNCQQLQLAAVQAAYALQRNLDAYEYDIKVLIETTPGNGQFESTVRFTGYSMAMIGEAQRVDSHAEEYYCMPNLSIAKYCFCL